MTTEPAPATPPLGEPARRAVAQSLVEHEAAWQQGDALTGSVWDAADYVLAALEPLVAALVTERERAAEQAQREIDAGGLESLAEEWAAFGDVPLPALWKHIGYLRGVS